MDEHERRSILVKLRETRDTFLGEVEGVSESQARWKPAPESWSILECAEHVAVAEQRMLNLLKTKTTPVAGGAAKVGREREILAHGTDRTEKQKSPEGAVPNGRFATLAEALRAFEANRSETIAHVEGCQEELRTLETLHARLGLVTAMECLALLAVHPARHALQIRELRQHPQFLTSHS